MELELVWEKLMVSDLDRLEKIKTCFLKRPLGLGKTAPSRMTYELARETFFIEYIRIRLLPSTGPYKKYWKY